MLADWNLFCSALALLWGVACGAPAVAIGFEGGITDALGARFGDAAQRTDALRHRPRHDTGLTGAVRHWNEVAIDASGVDHTPVAAGENRVFGEQLGPGRAARAMAIVHVAMFDALNAIAGGYRGYTGLQPGPGDASMQAALAQAAHDTLVAVYLRRPRPSMTCWPRIWAACASPAKATGRAASRSAGEPLRRSSRCAPVTDRNTPNHASASTSPPATSRASGGRIRSV